MARKTARPTAIKSAMNRPEVKAKHQAATKAALNRPEVKAKHKEAMNRPEVKTKRMEAQLDKQAKARSEVFKPEDLAVANSAVSQALGGGKSYAWLKPRDSSQ